MVTEARFTRPLSLASSVKRFFPPTYRHSLSDWRLVLRLDLRQKRDGLPLSRRSWVGCLVNDDQGPAWRCQRSISATGSLVYQRPSGARRGRNAVKAKMLLQLLEAVCTSCIGFVPEVALLRAGHFFVSRVAIGRRCASRVLGQCA